MSEKRSAMTTLARWVLGPQATRRRVLGRRHGRRRRGDRPGRPKSLRSSSTSPAARATRPTSQIAQIYGNGGDIAPLVPVVTLPTGTTVDSPGVTRRARARRWRRSQAAMPDARIASYASTHDRAFVSDGRPHDVRARLHPRRRRRRPRAGRGARGAGGARGRHRRRLPGRGHRAGRASRRRRPRATRAATEHARRDAARRARRAARPRLRLPLVHGDRAAADGARRHPDDVPAHLAARRASPTSR